MRLHQTQRTIRRGSFRNVKDLKGKFQQFVENYNPNAKAFVWTATADSILQKIERLCQVIYRTKH
jgi:putative transposase